MAGGPRRSLRKPERRQRRCQVKMGEREWEIIEKGAAVGAETVSDLVRRAALREARRQLRAAQGPKQPKPAPPPPALPSPVAAQARSSLMPAPPMPSPPLAAPRFWQPPEHRTRE